MKEMTIKEIQEALGYEIKIVEKKVPKQLEAYEPGTTVKLGKFEFIILEQGDKCTKLLLENLWKTAKFDDHNNNFGKSKIFSDLNKNFYKELSAIVGKENIIKHNVDLTSDDGRKDYGIVNCNISLLTCDMYREFVEIIDKYRITTEWWWLATPCSTASNGYGYTIRCASNVGTLNSDSFRYDKGVRPFCILKSNILVSE